MTRLSDLFVGRIFSVVCLDATAPRYIDAKTSLRKCDGQKKMNGNTETNVKSLNAMSTAL